MTPEQFSLFAEIEEKHWWFVARRSITRRIVQRVAPPGTARVIIDVGCGTGANIASLASDYRCAGIDTTEDAIRFARLRFPEVTFVHDDFPSGLSSLLPAIDILLCMDVIEHIKDDRAFLAKLTENLRPGSHLLLTVPADMALWGQHDVTNDHFRRYDRQSLERTWAGLPVVPRLVSYFNSRLYPLVRSVRLLSMFRRSPYGRDGTDLKMPAPVLNHLLRRIYEGEADRLLRAVDRPEVQTYDHGVSLLALLRRAT